MGQLITASVRAGASPNVRLFDLNRSLTGMETERYEPGGANLAGGRPPDVLAARLLDAGAANVTIYSNSVTVEAPVEQWADLEPTAQHLIEHLFEYYGDEAGWSYDARGLEAPPPVDLTVPSG